jgi:GDP/UDP-N,N'-diacetylbacillosamine 2-epimerase (hydrolysing)
MKRKICIVTGSRADYGLLRWIMQGINEDPELILQVIATGMHLSPAFGSTYQAIEADGFKIDRKIYALSDVDSPFGIAEAIGKVLVGCAQAYKELNPDIIVVLGDRFEIFAAVPAALLAKIPVAHLHGGETTAGAYDESFRHSITKMSQLHFVAAQEYKDRIVQLGESPRSVFLVGGLGVDSINKLELLDKREVESKLQLEFSDKNLLVTFHPVTLDDESTDYQMDQILMALADLEDTSIIFTLPNADTGGHKLMSMVKEFVSHHSNARAFTSLGQLVYLSCMAQVDAVLGNSSSGLIEAPSLKIGTVNIGDRQLGRLQASSVINCNPEKESVLAALRTIYSTEFQASLPTTINPYGGGFASEKVVEILRSISLEGIVKKTFYDL